MAARFWVGGTGTWNASSTANWSATSGGSAGASVPGSADTVTFDASSGGGTITLAYDAVVTSITMGAFTGTFDASTYNPTMSTFDCSGTGTRTLTMGSGIWHLTGTGTIFTTATTTNLTLNKGTAIIAVIDKSATGKTLTGGGLTYYNFFYSGTVASITLTNIFFDYKIIETNTPTGRKRLQEELNRLNSTTNLSVRDCLKSLAGGDQNRSTRDLANAYAGTTNQSTQWALNVKASRNPNTQEHLSKQDAAKLL